MPDARFPAGIGTGGPGIGVVGTRWTRGLSGPGTTRLDVDEMPWCGRVTAHLTPCRLEGTCGAWCLLGLARSQLGIDEESRLRRIASRGPKPSLVGADRTRRLLGLARPQCEVDEMTDVRESTEGLV